jgi:hypothetical protein
MILCIWIYVCAGSDTQEGMIKLSADLEALAGRGGFQFKGTLMTGDAAADPSEPRKVLGLIWETGKTSYMWT